MREPMLSDETQTKGSKNRASDADAIQCNAKRNLQATVHQHAPGTEIGKLTRIDGKRLANFVRENTRATAQQILVTEEQRQQEPVEIGSLGGFLRTHSSFMGQKTSRCVNVNTGKVLLNGRFFPEPFADEERQEQADAREDRQNLQGTFVIDGTIQRQTFV